MTRKDIEGAILSTIVVSNKPGLKYAIDNIIKLAEKDGVVCKSCDRVISSEDINSHLFMKTTAGLIHWNCDDQ